METKKIKLKLEGDICSGKSYWIRKLVKLFKYEGLEVKENFEDHSLEFVNKFEL